MKSCRHVICVNCEPNITAMSRCVCGKAFVCKKFGACNHDAVAENQIGLPPHPNPPPRPPQRCAIIFGNTSTTSAGTKGRSCTTFVEIKGLANLKSASFNINPSYSKPTKTVQFNGKNKVEFEYTMKRQYPCVITVSFKDRPSITIRYYVSHEKKHEGRIVVDGTEGDRKGVTFDAEQGMFGSVRHENGGRSNVTYGYREAGFEPIEYECDSLYDCENITRELLGGLVGDDESDSENLSRFENLIVHAIRGGIHDKKPLKAIESMKRAREEGRIAKVEEAKKQLSCPSRPSEFFQVSIDCPGYGNSQGDRQSVRSYPTALISDILTSLGVKKAFCVVGSSQGSCALFNALTERHLSLYYAAMHPISTGSKVQRYASIRSPTLLVYNCDDPGHPVKVGRSVKRVFEENGLPIHYVEFKSTEYNIDGDGNDVYEVDFMGTLMLRMFESFKLREPGGNREGGLNASTVVGGVGMYQGKL
ncbi:hypothetical protein TL16_g05939 [Triparma laevis f. inornata]|uniref:Uncharacterized protein n=2 Tax=Triparma laevis TaxID=1534972 RepID=A0A9W7FNG2_9STRA|nr:hypothetical protein TL16_g05939 [Triparma laevis f. inornata]GMI15922.1 hypothetical protein TrLO_g3320 [Triparma laevis f. longispina]